MTRKARTAADLPARRSSPIALSERGMRSSVLCELADDRVKEALILLSHKQFTGAAYIAGYGVELLLKAVIAAKRNAGYWPLNLIASEYRTHNLDHLLQLADLSGHMRQAAGNNLELGENWQIVRRWGTDFRYRRLQKAWASDIVQAVANERNGVAVWLRIWL